MCPLFKNKYVIGSIRYYGFDYSSQGIYFITICTKNRIHWFGKIENGMMILSDLGVFFQNEWLKTPDIRPDMNIFLDEFVIMPDHFHAIIQIGENIYNQNCGTRCRTTMHGGSTTMHGGSITMHQKNQYHNKFGPQIKNLSSIIRGVKSAVTTYARKQNMDFAWQSKYYDHIIRSGHELQRIRKYILENPIKWA